MIIEVSYIKPNNQTEKKQFTFPDEKGLLDNYVSILKAKNVRKIAYRAIHDKKGELVGAENTLLFNY